MYDLSFIFSNNLKITAICVMHNHYEMCLTFLLEFILNSKFYVQYILLAITVNWDGTDGCYGFYTSALSKQYAHLFALADCKHLYIDLKVKSIPPFLRNILLMTTFSIFFSYY